MPKIPLIDLQRQYAELQEELNEAARKVLSGGRYILGPEVRSLEEEVAAYCNAPYAVGLANGTDALVLSLDAAGIGAGDEVITTPYTFFSTAEAISRCGAVPVFVDIDPDSYNIDPALIEDKITPRTKAIIPVHLYGLPAEMDSINDIARRHSLLVIEDACQALGSSYKERPAGSLADVACFSFFPTKNLGGYGDGGMVLTGSAEIAEKIRVLRVHGGARKYYHTDIGYNSRLDELQAALLRVKLPHLDRYNDQRCEAAARYEKLFAESAVTTPTADASARHIYHLYILRSSRRDLLMQRLQEEGIGCGIYYPVPLPFQDVYRSLGYREGDLPQAEKAARENLAVPLFPEIRADEQQRVAEVINATLEKES